MGELINTHIGVTIDSQSARAVADTKFASQAKSFRSPLIDGLKGFTVVLMIIYHFCYDLHVFKYIDVRFQHDLFWVAFCGFILASFLVLVGINQVQAKNSKKPHAFLKRQAKLLVCSLLVTAGSYLMFPDSYIYFGTLHAIFVISFITHLMLNLVWVNLVAGIAIIALGFTVQSAIFNPPFLNWIGMMTHIPYTEDYVPLFPWMGFSLIGLFVGNFVIARYPEALKRSAPKSLQWLGSNSLIVYLVHQPIMVGLFTVVTKILNH